MTHGQGVYEVHMKLVLYSAITLISFYSGKQKQTKTKIKTMLLQTLVLSLLSANFEPGSFSVRE